MLKRLGLIGAVLAALLMAGCQGVPGGGGGSCWPLDKCPEEELTPSEAPPIMIPPPGGTVGPVVGEITLFVDIIGPDGVPLTRGGSAEVTVEHQVADPRAIPLVQDPFTGAKLPSPYTFIAPWTPFEYTVDIISDTIIVVWKVTAIIEVGHTLMCVMLRDLVPVAPPAEFTLTEELSLGRGYASVTCEYLRAT